MKNVIAAFLMVVFAGEAMADSRLDKFKAGKAKTVMSCQIEENYQRVFKRLNSAANDKAGATWLATALVNNSFLYSDLGEADISIKQTNPFGDTYFVAVEIKKVEDASTDMTVYVKQRGKGAVKQVEALFGGFPYLNACQVVS